MSEEFGCLDFLIDNIDFDTSCFNESPPLPENFTNSSPDSVNSWIGEIENQLMNDDVINHEPQQDFPELDQQTISEFLNDLFVDNPTNNDYIHNVVDSVTDAPNLVGKENKKIDLSNGSGSESHDGVNDDDVVAKKKTRQIRNRDAAVRSRERKKEYVQDLEKKSKYLERECLRLGRMLECFVAENNSLRLCLQKGNDASMMTRQESAVLLLESLLLGSLLWLLGSIIYQFPLPREIKESCLLRVVTQELEKAAVLSGLERSNRPANTGKCRRCKGSRPRMRYRVLTVVA